MNASMRERLNVNKVAIMAIIVNACQIFIALTVMLLALFTKDMALNWLMEKVLLFVMAMIVIWGAVLDIREAFLAKKLGTRTHMLEDAYGQLEELNGTLRAQRHDFMNHLQVVYSLMEFQDYGEAKDYIERVYSDIQKVGQSLKTGIPAVNALIAAKQSDAESRGCVMNTDIRSSWDQMDVPGWEMCRVLGNLIDNSLDALGGQKEKSILLSLGEDIHDYTFRVENNGPAIPESIRHRIFESGFSTKSTGRGMGLAIVSEILKTHGGSIEVTSDAFNTRFFGRIPKKAALDEDAAAASSAKV